MNSLVCTSCNIFWKKLKNQKDQNFCHFLFFFCFFEKPNKTKNLKSQLFHPWKSEEHFSQQTNQYYFTAKLPANQAILFHWIILKTAQSAIWRYFHVETTGGLTSTSRCQPTYRRGYSNFALTCICNVACINAADLQPPSPAWHFPGSGHISFINRP